MKDISIIIPTRGRPDELRRLISSLRGNESNRYNYDISIMCDTDDKTMEGFPRKGLAFYFKERGESLVRDYINILVECCTGKNVWFLADDCEVMTRDWDEKILELVGKNHAYEDNGGIFWGDTYDTTRDYEGVGHFSGFPVISRKAIDKMGYFFHPEIYNWGADKYTHAIYKEAEAIVDMQSIQIKHHHITDDDTSKNVQRIYEEYGSGSDIDLKPEIEKLKGFIGEHKRTISQTV